MGLGTQEWIHTLAAVVDTVCLFSSQLYTFYLIIVFVSSLNSKSENQRSV